MQKLPSLLLLLLSLAAIGPMRAQIGLPETEAKAMWDFASDKEQGVNGVTWIYPQMDYVGFLAMEHGTCVRVTVAAKKTSFTDSEMEKLMKMSLPASGLQRWEIVPIPTHPDSYLRFQSEKLGFARQFDKRVTPVAFERRKVKKMWKRGEEVWAFLFTTRELEGPAQKTSSHDRESLEFFWLPANGAPPAPTAPVAEPTPAFSPLP